MRVCFLHNNFYRSSGSAIVIERLYELLRGEASEFWFARCDHQELGDHDAAKEMDCFPAERMATFRLMDGGAKAFAEPMRFARWVRAHRIDLIHAHHRKLAVMARLLQGLTGAKVLYTAHNCFPRSEMFRWLSPRDATGVSESVAENLRVMTRARAAVVIANPLRFEPLQSRHRILAKRDLAISVGRLEPLKGHRVLIEAWRRMHARGLRKRLVIVGEGYLRGELERQIQGSGLEGWVELAGFRGDVAAMVENALFHVLVSGTEGFPNVVVEAAAQGRASLVTDVPGSRDTVPPCGRLGSSMKRLVNRVEFGNVDALADALEAWFAEPERVLDEGERFHAYLGDMCRPESIRDKYADVYRRLVKQTAAMKRPVRVEAEWV